MKRRQNIDALLLHEPELVFLDEPTVGIDPQSRNHVFELVDRLRAAGTTLVYTTHQLGEAERLCDRIVILDRGRTIAAGPHAGVGRDNPYKSSFIRGFELTEQERADVLAFLESLTTSGC